MLKSLFLVAATSCFLSASAQSQYVGVIDSVVDNEHFAEHDWAVSLYIRQAGTIPLYDSVGNVLSLTDDLFTTTVVYSINNVIYMQQFKQDCFDDDSCIIIGPRMQLPCTVTINLNADSIEQAAREWVHEFIYRDEDGGYAYQEDSEHSPHYFMTFYTRELNTAKFFSEICVEEYAFPDKSGPANLNYQLNVNTFIYRALNIIRPFINSHRNKIPER